SAIGAMTRLQDVGIEPFLLSSTLLGVIAQRLIRKLCADCKQAYLATETDCHDLGISVTKRPQLYKAKGCEACAGSGYRGRTGIYEIVLVDDHLRTMIHEKVSEQKMEEYSHQSYPNMRKDGNQRVLAGETTIEEVLRVTLE
ncbi:MAG TPA: type II secretion system protein GspE, partial [Gammaproteobacteria bacterium]|nr:type II secretion system protein GspE [Gammaproteobacteria bacterium]